MCRRPEIGEGIRLICNDYLKNYEWKEMAGLIVWRDFCAKSKGFEDFGRIVMLKSKRSDFEKFRNGKEGTHFADFQDRFDRQLILVQTELVNEVASARLGRISIGCREINADSEFELHSEEIWEMIHINSSS
jgi:hypothetical protein